MVYEFTVSALPPSVNGLFAGKARRFKTKEYHEWDWLISKVVAQKCLRTGRHVEMIGKPYRLEIELYRPSWWTKGNNKTTGKPVITMPDTPNLIKAAEDAVCKCTGWMDQMNVETVARKRHGETKTIIRFTFLDDDCI